MSLLSPAKLNLGLRVTGRRADGYHLLESLFWPIDLTDTLHLAPSFQLDVSARWVSFEDRAAAPPIPSGPQNLVWRALEIVQDAGLGTWAANIEKGIPMGAGLGGGSSNAGTVLRFFRDTATAAIDDAAPTLGADVPFFLNPVPSWVTGIGDRRAPLLVAPEVLKTLRFLVVLLPAPCDTGQIFSSYRASARPFSQTTEVDTSHPLDWQCLRQYLVGAKNDLEQDASAHCPLIASVLSRLRETSALFCGMSGSGSSCFALFDNAEQAQKFSQALQPFFRERGCRTLTASTYGS